MALPIYWIMMLLLGLLPLARVQEGSIAVMRCTNWEYDQADHTVLMVDQLGQWLEPITQAPNWGYVIKLNGKWVEITHMPLNAMSGPAEVRSTSLTSYCLQAIEEHFTNDEVQTLPFGPIEKTWRY
jgi:hypothetical protein